MGVLFQTPTALIETNRGLALFLGSITLETFRISMVILRAERNKAVANSERSGLLGALASGTIRELKLAFSPINILKGNGT